MQDTGFYRVKLLATSSGGVDSLVRSRYIYVVGNTGLRSLISGGSLTVEVMPNPVISNSPVTVSGFKKENSPILAQWLDLKGAIIRSRVYRPNAGKITVETPNCLLYTSPSPRD